MHVFLNALVGTLDSDAQRACWTLPGGGMSLQ